METSDMVKEIIRIKTGDEPQMHEPTCLLWKSDHKNCEGCPSNLQCAQMVAIMLSSLRGSMYEPKSYDDFVRTMDGVHETTEKILEAKTVDEVHSII